MAHIEIDVDFGGDITHQHRSERWIEKMKFAFKQASSDGSEAWEVIDGTIREAIADRLNLGGEVRAVCTVRGEKVRFESVGWLFVEFTQGTQLTSALIDHPFTAKYAAVVCLGNDDAGQQNCLIGFELPREIHDAAQYKLLLSGLATVYQAKESLSAIHAWRVPTGCATALHGSLDTATVENLEILGQENKAHRLATGMIRSRVRLDREANVQLRVGGKNPLTALDEGTAVCCPIHLDTTGVATVVGQGQVKAVQCPVCSRNYWNVPAYNDVDFGQFRRVFDEMYAQQSDADRQFTLLREQYLPALELQMGTTLVRSPKGSGKTEALKALVEKCKARGMSVLLIGHRRALLRAQSQRIDLDLYFEILDADGKGQFRSIKPTDRYAICLDSVPGRLRPDIHKFDVVLIDESEQVIRHLAGETLKEARRSAFRKLSHYLSVAEAVYLLDADLGMLSFLLAQQTVPKNSQVRFLVNEPEVDSQEYELVTSRKGLVGKLEAALDAGEKCYVATNSKAAAERLGLRIKERRKGVRVEFVTRDNSQLPRTQDLLCNVVEEFQTGRNGLPPLGVLIGTPSIGTGIDITFPNEAVVVDHVFGLFEGNITTHFDIDQQLARVRHPGKVSVWISQDVMFYETAPEALLSELRNTVLRTDLEVGFTREGLPLYSADDQALVKLWSEIMSYERASKNDLLRHWIALREANGWRGLLGITSDAEQQSGEDALLDGDALRDDMRVNRIVGAADIDAERAEELKEQAKVGAAMSVEDMASLEKYRLGEFYATEVNEELVGFDDDGRTRRHVEMLEIMIGDDGFNRHIDLKEIDRKDAPQVVVFDRQFRTVKAALMADLLTSAGLIDPASREFLISAQFGTDNLKAFVACMRKHGKRVEAELKVVLRRDIEKKPVQQLGDVLDLIGVELVLVSTTKVKGVKRRSYGIEAEGLCALVEVVVRRQQARQERHEIALKLKAEQGDNEPPIVNDHYGQQLSPDDPASENAIQLVGTQTSRIAKLVADSRTRKSNKTANQLSVVNARLDPMNLPFQP